jgi:hypothetical protein
VEVRERMAAMHARMREVVAKYSTEELTAVIGFLDDLSDVFDTSESFAALKPYAD